MNDKDLGRFLKEVDNTKVKRNRKEETVQLASRRFIDNRHPGNTTIWTLFKNNIGYISTGFWIGELLCLLLIVITLPVIEGIGNNKVGIFVVSIGTAILMVLCLPEIIRSFRHGMWELEKLVGLI